MHSVVSQSHMWVRALPGRESRHASVVVFSCALPCLRTADTIGIQIRVIRWEQVADGLDDHLIGSITHECSVFGPQPIRRSACRFR